MCVGGKELNLEGDLDELGLVVFESVRLFLVSVDRVWSVVPRSPAVAEVFLDLLSSDLFVEDLHVPLPGSA